MAAAAERPPPAPVAGKPPFILLSSSDEMSIMLSTRDGDITYTKCSVEPSGTMPPAAAISVEPSGCCGGGVSVQYFRFAVLPDSSGGGTPLQSKFSSSNSMSLTIRMQRILASDWNFIGMARTCRARLKKNSVLASSSRLACSTADTSQSLGKRGSLILRVLAGEGWEQLDAAAFELVQLRLMAVVCGDGCTRLTFELGGAGGGGGGVGLPSPKADGALPLRLCRLARFWNRPSGAPAAAAALSSFLKLSAAANRCGSIIRQPTLLAVLQLGVDVSGKPAAAAAAFSVNICAAAAAAGNPPMPMGKLASVARAAAFALTEPLPAALSGRAGRDRIPLLELLLLQLAAGGVIELSVRGATAAQLLLPLLLLLWFCGAAPELLSAPGETRLGGVAATLGVSIGVV